MDKSLMLAEIAKKVAVCQKCDLYKTATHGVPGEGRPDAKVAFIGEAPGFYEDQQGRPFVGAAGKLLEKMLAEIGLAREEVFIGNVIKHRPPENRDPLPGEVASCRPWLDQQLEIINPRVIVTLGRYSLAAYSREKISAVHGRALKVAGKIVLPLYHPAAALRAGAVMEQLRADFINNKDLLTSPETFNFANGEETEPQLDLFN